MNAIPKTQSHLITFAVRALEGARSTAGADLAQNTAARIEADIFAVVGDADPAGITGRDRELAALRAVLTSARATRRSQTALCLKFCADAVDLLKAHLGRTWNPRWQAAGFVRFSISTSRKKPLPLLLKLRDYFRAHPAHEHANAGITAARADVLIAAMAEAEHAVDHGRSRRKDASMARTVAVRQLRKRLTALRAELTILFSADDPRWLKFGFRCPADGRAPAAVEAVEITPHQAGSVVIRCAPTPRATHFRATWSDAGDPGTPLGSELFRDPVFLLQELPAGKALRFRISARNDRGESRAVERSVVVPGTAITPLFPVA